MSPVSSFACGRGVKTTGLIGMGRTHSRQHGHFAGGKAWVGEDNSMWYSANFIKVTTHIVRYSV